MVTGRPALLAAATSDITLARAGSGSARTGTQRPALAEGRGASAPPPSGPASGWNQGLVTDPGPPGAVQPAASSRPAAAAARRQIDRFMGSRPA